MVTDEFVVFREFECTLKEYIKKVHFNRQLHVENYSQMVLIHYLLSHQDKDVYQKDIEKDLNRSKATVSGILDTLEKKGIIERKLSENDRRKKHIVLTTKAIDELGLAQLNMDSLKDKMIRGIPESDLRTAIQVFRQMNCNLKEELEHEKVI